MNFDVATAAVAAAVDRLVWESLVVAASANLGMAAAHVLVAVAPGHDCLTTKNLNCLSVMQFHSIQVATVAPSAEATELALFY